MQWIFIKGVNETITFLQFHAHMFSYPCSFLILTDESKMFSESNVAIFQESRFTLSGNFLRSLLKVLVIRILRLFDEFIERRYFFCLTGFYIFQSIFKTVKEIGFINFFFWKNEFKEITQDFIGMYDSLSLSLVNVISMWSAFMLSPIIQSNVLLTNLLNKIKNSY